MSSAIAVQIEIGKLRDVTNRIFDFIESDLKVKSVGLPHNFYWSVPDDALYMMDRQPHQLDCGSLVDDLEFVMAAQKDSDQAFPLMLMHVAPLLKMLSTAVPSYRSPEKN